MNSGNAMPNSDQNFMKEGMLLLSEEEVLESRKKYGENRLSSTKRKGFIRSFLESFGDPMIKVLLIALAINVIFLMNQSSWFESVGIAVAILLATLVSTISEYGSESAFEKLQEEASKIKSKVKRTKGLLELPVEEIVVGDLVLLQTGDRIPADGVIVSGALDVDQSALNGESKEAHKIPSSSTKKEVGNLQNTAFLFSGTVVCSGEGLMRVTQIGDKTYYGKIGKEIQQESVESPLRLRLRQLASSISQFGYFAAFFTIAAYFFNVLVLDSNFKVDLILQKIGSWDIMFPHLLKACTLAVTVIVMAVPEGLPMMITVVLSANMKRMLKDHVLVRKLVGIETAGSMNILFTDKTGTITKGKLNVVDFIGGSGKIWSQDDKKLKNSDLWKITRDAVINNCSASMSGKNAIGGNATDRALLEFVCQDKKKEKTHSLLKKVKVIPFTSNLKYMATTVSGKWNITFIKGAPEKILPFCSQYYDESGNAVELSNTYQIEKILGEFTDKAFRVIAIATMETGSVRSNSSPNNNSGFHDLRLIGLAAIRDDVRPEAITGIRQVQNAGIQTVMITGDAPVTAQAIAKEAGLIRKKSDLVLTSEEMRFMNDDTLIKKIPDLRVIARALPTDKSRLVRLAQKAGLVVGMTGDGVNDAPALKQADIGFAMGSGTEVAKEAGDIVILDDNFISISKAVCYGRTIFKSIRKFIIYQLSICMCAVGVTVIGPLVGVDFPITVIQMLWINIVMDTLAGLAFSGEKARLKYMEEPPKSRNEKIINSYMKNQIVVNSIYSTLLSLFFLKSSQIQSYMGEHTYLYKMTSFFALFMFLAIFTSFCARTHHINLLDYLAGNKPFLWIMGMVTCVQVFIIYFGGEVFRTVKLEPKDLFLIILLAFTIIPVDMIRKWVIGRHSEITGT